MAKRTTEAEIQRISVKLRRLLSWLFASLAVLLLLERFGSIGMQLFQLGLGGDRLRRLAFACVLACPETLYLLALWWIRQALAVFAKGTLYASPITRMLDRVGTTLSAGAFLSVFLVPTASRAIGFAPGYVIAYDVAALVLGAVGLSLKVIAHVLGRASEMQAELDEIF